MGSDVNKIEKQVTQVNFLQVIFCVHGSWGEIGNFLRLLQAFSTQVHQAAQRFPYLLRQTLWETLRSTERPIKKIELMVEYVVACGLRHPSERTQTTICALLTTICISWVPGLILDFSGGYVRFGYKRICVWMQYHAISQKNQTNADVPGDKKQCTCMCLIPNHHKRMYV